MERTADSARLMGNQQTRPGALLLLKYITSSNHNAPPTSEHRIVYSRAPLSSKSGSEIIENYFAVIIINCILVLFTEFFELTLS